MAVRAEETISTACDLSAALLSQTDISTPFLLEGQITCLIPHGERYLYMTVSDATGCAFLTGECAPQKLSFSRGDRIRVRGSLQNNEAHFAAIEVCEKSAPEAPRPVTARDIAEGKADWQFVRIAGTIRDICNSETDRRWTFLVLTTGDETLYVGVPRDDYQELLGASVSIDGFPNPRDRSPRVYFGRTFHCAGKTDIRILNPDQTDPFAVPSIQALRHLDPPRIAQLGRHQLQGRVLCRWKGDHVLVRTPDREVVRLLVDGVVPEVGTDLVASGFPETDFFHLTLSHALWRRTDKPLTGIPDETSRDIDEFFARLNSEQPFHAGFHGQLLTLKGVVRSLPQPDVRDPQILVDCEGHLIPLSVDCLTSPDDLPPLGAEISVTGTCVLLTEDYRTSNLFPQINGLMIVLNHSEDLTILRTPSWWTTERLVGLIASLLTLLALLLIWNRILNRLVERRGKQLLNEQLGHAAADLRSNERMRLAVELHDSLAQNLTGVSMEIEAASRCGTAQVEGMVQHLTIADKALKSCRNELRNTLWDLRNQSLEAPDFNEAVHKTLLPHIKHVTLKTGIAIPRAGLSDNTLHDLLCIIRELTLNAIRHGGATIIEISGSLVDSIIRLSVTDNGCGFDPDDSPGVSEGHFGLEGIRERLREPGGELTFVSHPHGMTAIITYPL